MTTSAEQIKRRLSATDPVLYVVTHEEHRVREYFKKTVEDNSYDALLSWSLTEGTRVIVAKPTTKLQANALIAEHAGKPNEALQFMLNAFDTSAKKEQRSRNVVLLLADFGHFLSTPSGYSLARQLKDLREKLQYSDDNTSTVVIIDSEIQLPARLEKVVTVIDYDLPTEKELHDIGAQLLAEHYEADGQHVTDAEVERQARLVASTAQGLTFNETLMALKLSIASTGTVDAQEMLQEKKSLIKKSGVLEYYEAPGTLDNVGGQGNLKKWLKLRAAAFSKEAREFGLPSPKGMLLVGVPGTGKSLVAKTIGREWNMPVLRLDIGSLFGSLIGESESKMRKALKTAIAAAPCVLFIDELDKAVGSSSERDGGTAKRVFGHLLTWLSDKTEQVFVVCTANDVSGLPPELLRAGRFDAIFWMDLPATAEREEIAKIVASRFKRDKAAIDYHAVAQASDKYSGAEIETAFISAMYKAFNVGSDVSTTLWVEAIGSMVPLSTTMEKEIKALREWAATKAIPASTAVKEEAEVHRNPIRNAIRLSLNKGNVS